VPLDVVTFNDTVQEPLAGIEPPVKVTLEVLTLADPPHVVLAGPETTIPLGKVSVSGAVSFAAVLLGLLKLMRRDVTPPAVIVAGLKDLRRLGGVFEGMGVAVKVATAGAVLLPLLVCIAPMGSVLMQEPSSFSVTVTVTIHEPLAGIEPPVKVTVELYWTAASVPPQVVLARPAISRPAGIASTNGAVSVAAVLFGLLKVMMRVESSPTTIVGGLKALLTVGLTITRGVTVKVAMAGAALLPLTVCNTPAASELI
jgi:hypothetical protein